MARLSVRGTLVVAFVAFEVVVVALTEGLSVGRHLTPGVLAGAWLLVTLAAAVAFLWSDGTDAARTWLRGGGAGRCRDLTSSPSVATGTAVLVVIGLVLVATALLYLPNNADSLVYHLARVANWEQAGSVAHYATHYTAQLELAPLHEFNMLHLHLLADSDMLDGFVQLLSFVICVVGASEVARLLGANREVQVASAVIAAVVPSAVLEATSTQNNLFAAAVGVAMLVVLLAWTPLGPVVPPALLFGAAGGLALLTKGTSAPLLGPALLLLAARIPVIEARRSSWAVVARRAVGVAAVAAAAALLIVGPFLKRNPDMFGSFGGPVTRGTLNSEVSVRASAGNVVNSVAMQLRMGDGSGIDSAMSRAALGALKDVHEWTGSPVNDPAFTIGGSVDVFAPGDFSEQERNEDYGSNPWHVGLMVFAGIVFTVGVLRGDRSSRLPLLLAVSFALGFVAFASTTRWSLYGVRYQLPLLVLWAPLIAIAVAAVHRILLRLAVVLLVVVSVPFFLDNYDRPILDRVTFASDLAPYFAPRPVDGLPALPPEEYVALRDTIVATGCDRVGIGNWVLFEYPLWVGLDNAGWKGELRHVGVRNASRVAEDPSFEPCATIRQTFLNPPLEPIEGKVDIPFGNLSLAVDEDLVDRLPAGTEIPGR
jgi:hypothetical protein